MTGPPLADLALVLEIIAGLMIGGFFAAVLLLILYGDKGSK